MCVNIIIGIHLQMETLSEGKIKRNLERLRHVHNTRKLHKYTFHRIEEMPLKNYCRV